MSVVTSIRFPDELSARMRTWCEQRRIGLSPMIIKAVEAYISEGTGDRELREERLAKVDEITGGNRSKAMSDALNDAILRRMETDADFIANMDSKDFARLVAGRLPKEEAVDVEAEKDVLTLQQFVAGLPDTEDVTAELSRVRLRLKAAEVERDIARAEVEHVSGSRDLRELMRLVYRLYTEYVWECVVRNSLPGLGDGGGLSEKGLEAVARRVERDLSEVAP